MAHREVLHFLCALGVLCLLCAKGLTALVETQRTVMAALGEEAHFSCQLMQPKDVVQVTWQKSFPEGEKNLATYNKYFGPKLNPDFREKVEIKAAGLQNCSIIIMNVTEQDEGCYYCLFNTYPEGAFIGTTCLQLYELQEPVLYVRESNSEEAVVPWLATGLEEESGSNNRHHTVFIVVASIMIVGFGCAAVVLIVHRLLQNNQNREAEMNEMPEIRETYKTEELLVTRVTDQNRQQTSPGDESIKRQAKSITKETGVLT